MKGRFTGADGDNTPLETPVHRELLFPGFNLFKSHRYVSVQLFAFRSEAYAPVGSYEQCTAQGGFQVLDGARDVGLVVQENVGSLCKVFLFCNVIKDSVIVVADDHSVSFYINFI